MHLTETFVSRGHEWCGKTIRELSLPKNSLAILIRRGTETIIPGGQTIIQEGDTIVVNALR
ncbi:TrkA C-terminal domain-containing protein [Lachnoclostridium sp. Marseille-P6806]|uniref:TrkA C-terminal domain-containing protein n=1 Tax=Lachnoclostridium sp. Marseille-P6806 TaxID=2364793 RepID=UPI00356341A1